MDESKERFSKLKAQFANISHNMTILIAMLEHKFGCFGELGSSNSKASLNRKFGENKAQESKKDPKKERPNSNAITSSQSLFKMDVKVDIKPYQREIDVKLNQ